MKTVSIEVLVRTTGNNIPPTKYISTIKELERLFQEYEQEVLTAQNSGYLQPNTTRTYLLHSGNFVKWCKDEFEPGAKNK